MLHDLQNRIKIRAFLVFSLIHVGLIASIASLARLSADVGGSPALWIALASTLLIYLGIVLTVFFIIWPLLPLISAARKAREATTWIELAARELPALLESLPKLVEALQRALAALRDSFNNKK